ncbi:F420-dependent NADP oxidoreductase [Gramella sp. GC03-9]|uniref:F420-dependent NADP oxidoreductase n=1 Tax=Christiangramia oceanisediminis TaxID=2920386 RepID=A0A9X2KYT1_9FLAO|nr:Rossmann-like and DUF2520 domain-containing protein [Gramella oceanisediminis]MCP9200691.1 F420-dependent NADP oxidoreductase [Gramella oceanisediminis]
MINVVIIGAGNVAAHLYQNITAADGLEVLQVYNRTAEHLSFVKDLKKRCTRLEDLEKADLYLIAVKDEAIEEIAGILPDFGGLVAHTSGSQPLKTLSKFKNFGVFYPLQTFSKNKEINFRNVPLCLEANSAENLEFLKKAASKLSDKVFEVNSEQRKALHLSAVFVNNFSNHMYALAAEYCKLNGLPFKILQPLIKETAAKIETLPPYSAQTGPALRNDQKTIHDHLEMLEVDQKKIYTILTQSIQKLHGKKL